MLWVMESYPLTSDLALVPARPLTLRDLNGLELVDTCMMAQALLGIKTKLGHLG